MQFGLCIWYVVLLALTFVLTVSTVPVKDEEDFSSVPAKEDEDLQNMSNCKALCNHCGCRGFYCGEECICECDADNKEDMQCLETMQDNCEKLNIPFKVLIQGPSENRFVRSALLLDQENKQCLKHEPRSKRSTAVIYKPGVRAPLANALINIKKAKMAEKNALKNGTQLPISGNIKNGIKSHQRRGVPSFFDDHRSLVVPAPLPGFGRNWDLQAAGTENIPSVLAPAIPELTLPNLRRGEQIGNAVAKMREALLSLNARTEQLLSAAQTPGALALRNNLRGLMPLGVAQNTENEYAVPEQVSQVGDAGRQLFPNLFNNFPRLNNLLN